MDKHRFLFLPLIAAILALAVTGCDDGSDEPLHDSGHDHGHDHGGDHDHGHHAAAGRLIYTSVNGTNSRVYVYDLAEGKAVGDFALTYPINPQFAGLYSSPEGRYAVVVQRADGQVQFVDSGIEPHGDHVHKHPPELLPFTLTGTLPTHYKAHGEQAAIFFDGESGVPAEFVLLTEESIAAGNVVAKRTLSSAHHGIAVPLGGVVLASYAVDGSAAGVTLYQLHADHFHDLGRIEVACPGLHGAAVNSAEHVVFGCDDGLLVVPPEAYDPGTTPDATEAYKIPFASRISTLVGHHELAVLYGAGSFEPVNGNYFYKKLYVIHPDAASNPVQPLNWAGGATDAEGNPISAYVKGIALGPHGEHLVILGENGVLYVVEAANQELIAQIEVLQSAKDGVSPALAFSADGSKLYIADPAGNEINIVNMEELALAGHPIELNFAPVGLVWAGPRAEHEHHHDEEHGDEHSHEHNDEHTH